MSTPAAPAPAAPSSERLHALDACRAAAMFLGVFLHAAIPYQTIDGSGWAFDDAASSSWMSAAVHITHSFRMPLFFLLAGFFAVLLIERRGVRGMLANRGARLVVPLVLGCLTLSPLCALAWAVAADEAQYVTLRGLAGEVIGFWHLWFLRDLVVLCAAAGAAAVAVPRGWLARLGRAAASITLHPLGLLALTAAFALSLVVHPWWGLHGPGNWPRWENMLHHGLWFALGAALWPARSRLQILARRWWVYAGVAIAASAANLALGRIYENLGGFDVGSIAEEPLPLALLSRTVYALLASSLVLTFLGLFLRFLGKPSPAVRYLSDASYWAYLIHFPLVVLAGRLVLPLDVPAEAKVALVLLLVTPLLLGTYALFVRRTVIGRVLNGPQKAVIERGGRADPSLEPGAAVAAGT